MLAVLFDFLYEDIRRLVHWPDVATNLVGGVVRTPDNFVRGIADITEGLIPR